MSKCKKCKSDFKPYTTLQKLCFDCTVEKAKLKVKKDKVQKWKNQKKEYRESKTDYFKLLQKEINLIARLIDYNQLCISCQKIPKKTNGCHYKSVGGHASLRYNLFNIYSGCEKCNSELGGNVHGFDSGLIEVFGKEFWEYLKFQFLQDFPLLQMKKEDAKDKLKIARQISKGLKEDLIKRSPSERLEMRKITNERLGIYKIKVKIMENGIELIRKEREEQIEKHNRTVDLDIKINDEYQLPFAASVLSHPFLLKSEMISSIPKGWDLTIWTKMCSKTRKERYIIAGALIAAELDRLINQS